MHFTIITPSFNQLVFLRRCIASVVDQTTEGIGPEALDVGKNKPSTANHQRSTALSVHHHVQDGGSSDGTVDWLRQYGEEVDDKKSEVNPPNVESQKPNASFSSYTFTYESALDNGMYDAINRGVKLAIEGTRRQAVGSSEPNNQQPIIGRRNASEGGTINLSNHLVAWLNCDEQYLPGTLEFVARYFEQHPDVDMLFGDYLIVDERGELLSYRKGSSPRRWYIQASHLNNLSCAMFFRAGVFQALGGFDTKYKAVADEDFVVRALKNGFRARHVKRYFSTFTFTGQNLGGGDVGRREFEILKKEIPILLKLLKVPLNLSRWVEKSLRGTYYQRFPLTYSIYAGDTEARKEFVSQRAGWKWPEVGRQKSEEGGQTDEEEDEYV